MHLITPPIVVLSRWFLYASSYQGHPIELRLILRYLHEGLVMLPSEKHPAGIANLVSDPQVSRRFTQLTDGGFYMQPF